MTKSELKNKLRRGLTLVLGLAFTVPQMLPPAVLADEAETHAESSEIEEQGSIFLDLSEGGTVAFELSDGSRILYEKQQDGNITRSKGKKTRTLETENGAVLAYTGTTGEEVTVHREAREGYMNQPMEAVTENETKSFDDLSQVVQITPDDLMLKVTFTESEESDESSEEESDEDEDSDQSETEESAKDDAVDSVEEKPKEESSMDESSVEPDESTTPFEKIAEDSILSKLELKKIDFSSKRLLIAGDENLIIDPEHVLSSYDGVYLLQYEDEKTARNAFSYYYGKAAFVDVDTVLEIAEGDDGANGTEAMTENANPLSELQNAVEESPKKNKGTVIALIDTGVNDMTNVVEAVSMIGDDPADDNGHGTRMAQILREINPDVKILSIKALGANGTGDASAVYAAIAYAMERGASIINLSISAAKKTESASIETIINEAVSRGITVVGAAGNKGKNAAYYIPGSIESAYIIGACDENGQRIGISNYGDTVDFNAVAGSTSEAAATFSAILSKSGKAEADEQIIFPTNYEPKEDEPEPGEDEDGDFHVSIGPNQDPTMGRANTPTGTQTLAEYLGLNTDNFRNNLMSHNSDHYYITTPYGGSYGEPDSMTNANGASGNGIDSRWAAGMNCAGWVARAIIDGGVSKATLRAMCEWVQNNTTYQGITSAGSHGGSYANASFYNWFATNYAKNGGTPIEHYWYETKSKMLAGQSGGFSYGGTSVPSATYIPKKGDIIFCEIDRQNMDGGSGNAWGWSPQDGHVDDYGNSIDVHIGIYWGDTAGEDRWWQSAHGSGSGPAKYTTYSGNSQGNVLSTIAPKSQSIFLVIPMGMPDSPDTAFLTVHKDSSNPDVTEGNTKYNMAGIQYTAYTNSGCTTVAKDINGTNAVFTLKKNGDAKETYEFEVDEAGKKLWIKETYVPEDSGYVMNDTKYTTTLKPQDSADEKVIVAVKDAGDTDKVRVKKVSSDTAVTSGNNSYDMTGIVYRVYTDADCTTRAKNVNGKNITLTLDAKGVSDEAEMAYGTYWMKEYSVSAATGYKLSSTAKKFTLDASSPAVTTVEMSDPPVTDTAGIVINKVDEKGNVYDGYNMAGAEYTVKFYAGQYTKSNLPGSASATWVIKTVKSGDAYKATLNDTCIVSGTAKYGRADDGSYIIPLGTLTIQETKAPAGFKIEGSTLQLEDGNGSDATDGVILLNLVDENSSAIVKSGNQTDDTKNGVMIRSKEIQIRGGVKIKKINKATGKVDPRTVGTVLTVYANGTIADAKYGRIYAKDDVIKNKSGNDLTITIGNDGLGQTTADALPPGKYYLKETTIVGPFKTNTQKITFTVGGSEADDGKIVDATETPFENEPVRGGVKFAKVDADTGKAVAQGDGTFAGYEITIYADETIVDVENSKSYAKNDAVMSIKGREDGIATTGARDLAPGKYYAKETKAPAGYKINANWNASFTISGEAEDDGKVIEKDIDGKALLFTETVIRGDVRIEKWDKNLMRKAAQGDADFSGIQFEIKNASKESVVVENKSFEVGAVVKTLTTDAAGDAETTGKTLPYGTYTIREIKTNNKYLLTDGTARIFVIREDGEIVTTSMDQNSLHFDNTPVKGGISVQKDDKERASGETQGDADISGIRFAIVNDSEKLVKVSGRELDPGLVVAIIATSTKGKAETAKDLLPYGTYHVYELRMDAEIEVGDPYEGSDKLGSSIYANKSYLFAANEFEVKVTENNKLYPVNFQNDAVRGGVKVGKIDRETDQNVPQGLATLKDAEFTIYNSSKESVMVGGVEYKTGEAIRSFISDENGIFETAADLLPYGTYTVKETKAPIGYLLNEKWQVTFQIREEGVIVDTMTEEGKTEDPDTSGWLEVKAGSGNNPAEVPDDIIRGDITFKKVDIDGYPMAGIPFVIQRLDADGKVVESHVIVSDEDGLVSTKSRKKTDDKVNCLDQYVKDGVFADDSKLDGSAGVWFGEQSARDDSRGALIYADYQIKELRCKANEGQDLLMTDEPIEIRENNVEVQLSNTLVDLNIQLESEAMDVTSDSKVVTYGTDVKLSDTVSYIHLKVYNEYELVTTFYNIRKDGEAVKLGEGSITFTPEKADNTKTAYGEVTNVVTIDSIKAEPGTEVVAVDHLYKIEDGTKTEVASHNTDHTVESQKLFVPEMKTEASDSKTKDHVGTAEVEASISDILKYKNLAEQKIYLVTAKLRDAESGEEVADPVTRLLRINYKDTEVTQKMLYWQGPKDGTLIMPAFSFDASAMEGRTLVVTETLTDMDSKEIILTHEALDDADQQIHYIKVRTEAKDGITNTHVGTVTDKATVIDQVTIENAVIGETYVITGSLVYQEDCTDADGVFHKAGEVIAEHEPVEVTAEETTIVKDLAFTLDASKLEGISGTVFEDVYHKNILVGTHHDIHSKPQTIHWPKVRTTATDKETRTHTGVVGEKASIIDEVQLTNLVPGETYKVIGTLKTSEGDDFLVEGKPLTVEQEVIADKAKMTIPMEFTFDSSDLKGRSLVVFEKLLYADVEVSRHEDKTDKGQTISYPDGKTNASDSSTKDQVSMVTETDTIIDTVSYHNLVVGETYTIKGQLMFKEPFTDLAHRLHKAGEPVLDEEGKPVTTETTFEAKEKDGSVDLVYTLDSSLLKGATVVVFEDLYSNGAKVFSHADLEDEDQSVWYPSVRTMAIDTVTEDHVGTTGSEAVIRDTVELKNLKIGEIYKVYGTLMDKDSGEAITNKDGDNITAESDEFVAESRDMTIVMEFYFDASIRENLSTVVFEELIHKDVVVVAHADINDEGQSVHHPAVHTTATDEETGEHVGRARKKTVIHDTVKLYNLVPGMTYELEGYLVDSETGEPYLDATGSEVRVHSDPFKAERGKENTEMILTFTFNGSNLEGRSITVFEDLYHNGHIVAAHRLKNDRDQMVDYPDIHTNAMDQETGDHISRAGEKVTIIDEVTYTNLRPGLTYKIKGVLMNKETGKALKVQGEKITVEKKFTPKKKEGSVELEFTFDASALAGKTVVVFEDVYFNEIEVAVHHDIKDEDQTVVVPEVHTSVRDEADGDRLVKSHEVVTLVDTVNMKNLKPGEEYIVRGILMNKRTGEAFMENGTPVIADSGYFTADSPEVNMDVRFIFNTNGVDDIDLVVFEKLYIVKNGEEIEVGSHEDMGDKNQTVHVKPDRDNPKTGDTTKIFVPILVMIGSLVGIIIVIWRKRKLG